MGGKLWAAISAKHKILDNFTGTTKLIRLKYLNVSFWARLKLLTRVEIVAHWWCPVQNGAHCLQTKERTKRSVRFNRLCQSRVILIAQHFVKARHCSAFCLLSTVQVSELKQVNVQNSKESLWLVSLCFWYTIESKCKFNSSLINKKKNPRCHKIIFALINRDIYI